MKRLNVPYLAGLDSLDLSSIGFFMESKAYRDYINEINWKEYGYKPIAVFDIARSDKYMYIRYFVKGHSLKASFDIDNSNVHRDSCVEFFMKRVNDSTYMNFEFNCIGTCDAARRLSRTEKSSLTPQEYESIKRYTTLERRPFKEKTGIYEWELLVAIPLTLMGLDSNAMPEKILGNFYKCADDTEYPHFASWNPIDLPQPDFHCPQFFGEIYF